MHVPELEEVVRLSRRYNLIPISREIWADTETPIRVFHHFYQEKHAFMLESVEGGVKWARYSFIGMNPFMIVKGKDHELRIEMKDGIRREKGNPVQTIQRLLQSYKSPALPELPRFTGGAVGFFGYDLLKYYDNLPPHRLDDLQMNDVEFMFCDQVIAFDHFRQKIKIIANVHVPQDGGDAALGREYAKTCAEIDRIVERLQKPLFVSAIGRHTVPNDVELGDVRSNMKREEFVERVERAQAYIRAGDVRQVVLSQRFEIETDVDPLHVYRVLRTHNPSPYMYVLKLDEEMIVGTSPELLVRVEGERVLTRPIAGTRPRGRTEKEDVALERELLADQKERAEHEMLVDTGREDLAQVCEADSVECDSYMQVERYSHVMHLVSNLSGRLRRDKDFFDAFLSCLPAGTVSGAPRLRAMEIISELENEARGAYAGSIGYLGFSGNLDTCITIRTIIFKHGKAYVQAGAGIVHDSIPQREYEETKNKAKGMLLAIRLAEAMKPAQAERTSELNQDYYFSMRGDEDR